MGDALWHLYNRYDGRPPKHLLEAALIGKTQVEIAIDTLNRQAKGNLEKADDWDRAARFADKSKRPDAPARAAMHREDAQFHRDVARRQYREAAKLARKANQLLDNATLAAR